MGAGVAASPHCPIAKGTKPGRRGSPRGACSKPSRSRGLRWRLPGSFRGRSRFRFPRWLPDRPEALAVRRSAVSEPKFLFPPSGDRGAEAPRLPFGGIPGRSQGSASRSRTEALDPPLRSSRTRRSGPARQTSSRSRFPAGGGARTEVPLSAGPVLDRSPLSGLVRFVGPEGLSIRLGALRSLPLSHPLKGKPAASAWRRLRQPPRLRSLSSSSGGTMRSVSLGPWLEIPHPFPVAFVPATAGSCHDFRVGPS